jgi:hypothetical protein
MSSNRDRRPWAVEPRRRADACGEYLQRPPASVDGGAGWRIEAEHLDRGGGRRSWFVVRHGEQAWYCAGRGKLVTFLEEHGVAAGDIAAPEAGLPPGQDGCE